MTLPNIHPGEVLLEEFLRRGHRPPPGALFRDLGETDLFPAFRVCNTESRNFVMAAFPAPVFDRYRVELRLAKPAVFPFEHGGVLRGLVSRALARHRLPAGLIPFGCESGRVRFAAGDGYVFGLTLAGAARALADDLLAGFKRHGAARPDPPAPVLDGDFVVERVERLRLPDLDADAGALDGRAELVLHAPLRLERPAELKRRGAGHLDRDCFPAGFFLDRLLRRVFFLAENRYPESAEVAALAPPTEGCEAVVEGSLVERPAGARHPQEGPALHPRRCPRQFHRVILAHPGDLVRVRKAVLGIETHSLRHPTVPRPGTVRVRKPFGY